MAENTKNNPIYIDGQPFAARILTSKEWDQVLDTVGLHNELLHYTGHAFWCQDKDASGWVTARGGKTARSTSAYSERDRGPVVGYRPCLVPLDPATLQEAPERISHVSDGSILTMASLYIYNTATPVPHDRNSEGRISSYYGGSIRIGDSASSPDKQIQWVKAGGLLVADRTLLQNISYYDLDTYNLVYGRAERILRKTPLTTHEPYTKNDLTFHEYYNGLRTNLQDMLENACFDALRDQHDYALYLEPQGTYAMARVGGLGDAEARFGSNLVAVASPVRDYAKKQMCVYVQAGPAWERENARAADKCSLRDIIRSAQEAQENKTTDYPPQKKVWEPEL